MTWSFDADFKSKNTGSMGDIYAEGFYAVDITRTSPVTTRAGAPRVLLDFIVADGPMEGYGNTEGVGIPQSDDDFAWKIWFEILISLGADRKKLKAKRFKINEKLVLGKRGYIYFCPPPEGSRWPKVKWYPQAAWERRKQAFDDARAELNGDEEEEGEIKVEEVNMTPATPAEAPVEAKVVKPSKPAEKPAKATPAKQGQSKDPLDFIQF